MQVLFQTNDSNLTELEIYLRALEKENKKFITLTVVTEEIPGMPDIRSMLGLDDKD